MFDEDFPTHLFDWSAQLSDQDFLSHLPDMSTQAVGQFPSSQVTFRCLQVSS
ncbi:hypothetical protein GBA52_014943 [Prunus armeniaca]|nr:hypothetical protein GBA52_014943 [Prunus armeniaca]